MIRGIIRDPPAFFTLDYFVVWSAEGRPCASPEAAAGPPAVSALMAPTWRLHLATFSANHLPAHLETRTSEPRWAGGAGVTST